MSYCPRHDMFECPYSHEPDDIDWSRDESGDYATHVYPLVTLRRRIDYIDDAPEGSPWRVVTYRAMGLHCVGTADSPLGAFLAWCREIGSRDPGYVPLPSHRIEVFV